MQRDEGFVHFLGEADRFYQLITSVEEVLGLWEQLAFVSENNEVDYETIFEMPVDNDVFKVIYGPPFTVVFQNTMGGFLLLYSIRRPGF